jgi:hypothetical protein
MKYNSVIMTLQIKDMANFIMHILVEFFFSDSYLDLNSNAVIMKTAWGSHFWFDRLSWSHSSCDRSVFFPGTPVSSLTNKTDLLDITEILLKLQIKDMANFIMHVLIEFIFSDSYLDLNLNAVIMKLHEEVIFDLIGCHDCMLVATDLCFFRVLLCLAPSIKLTSMI